VQFNGRRTADQLPMAASLHSLRHSHCSHLLASLPAVSVRLGHGSIRTTQEIYSNMIHGLDDEAARKWEESQDQPAPGEPQQKGRVPTLDQSPNRA
jgi:integrase